MTNIMSGNIPEDLCKSIFIALPKKFGTSLLSQVTKLILRVLLACARWKIREHIAEEQYGFMSDKGIRNATFILRMLSKRAIEMQKDLFVCFIDYEKAFDNVTHIQMF